MVVVDSQDKGGGAFVVREAWTLTYGTPLPKSFYGSDATSGLAADCAVSVMDGVIEATFTRAATIAPTDQLGANVTQGVDTTVVWAFGEAGGGFMMDYHLQHRGTAFVTW